MPPELQEINKITNVFIMTRLKRTKTGKGTVSSSCCRGAEDHEHRTTQVGRDQTDLSSFEYLKGQSFHNTSYNLFHPHGKINLPSTQAEFPVLQLLPCSWCTCHKSGSICSKGSPLPVGEAGRSPFTLLLLRLNTPDSLHLSWCAMCSFPLLPECPVTGLAKGSCPLLEVLFEVGERETWRGDSPYQGKQDFHK